MLDNTGAKSFPGLGKIFKKRNIGIYLYMVEKMED